MTSEWMKVMLDEIARKKAVAEQERLESEQRRAERAASPAAPASPGGSPGATPAPGEANDSP